MCCESLEAAALQIAARPGSKGPKWKELDANLFIVKHLLILREQTTPYRHAASQRADATLPTRELSIDFAKMRSSFMEDKGRWFELSSNNAFLEILFTVSFYLFGAFVSKCFSYLFMSMNNPAIVVK